MKSIYKSIMIVLAAGLLAASCDDNQPAVFDDANAFVAFDNAAVTCSEDQKDVVRIPVTLASVAGIEESIGFTVSEPETKGAKAGVNYDLVTTSGVLSFTKEARTQYIELNVKYDGIYTGDLKLEFTLNDGATVGTGAASKCVLTIGDVDHPLNPIVGDYTMSGEDQWAGPSSWKLTLYKDPEDDHKVWFENLYNNSGWIGEDIRYYGVVTMEGTDPVSIYIPFGQESEYVRSNGDHLVLLGLSSDGDGYDTGGVDVAIKYDGGKVTLDFGAEWGFWAILLPELEGNIGVVWAPLVAVK